MRLLLLSFVLLASTMVNAQSFRVGPTVRAWKQALRER